MSIIKAMFIFTMYGFDAHSLYFGLVCCRNYIHGSSIEVNIGRVFRFTQFATHSNTCGQNLIESELVGNILHGKAIRTSEKKTRKSASERMQYWIQNLEKKCERGENIEKPKRKKNIHEKQTATKNITDAQVWSAESSI